MGPPGQHATFPIGGDEHTDPGAGDADNKGITGSAIGAGLAALPAAPIAAATGAVVGAYAGSLLGSLQGMHEKDVSERHAEPPPPPCRSRSLSKLIHYLEMRRTSFRR